MTPRTWDCLCCGAENDRDKVHCHVCDADPDGFGGVSGEPEYDDDDESEFTDWPPEAA